MSELMTVPEWHKEAACSNHPDPELWSYQDYQYKDERQLQVLRSIEALEICNECPVRELCLKQGLEEDNMYPGTIWGGLLFSERLRLKPIRDHHKFTLERRFTEYVRAKVKRY